MQLGNGVRAKSSSFMIKSHKVHILCFLSGVKSEIILCCLSGEYLCVHSSEQAGKVKFDLVVVQPISFNQTPRIQMVKLNEPNHRIHCGVTGKQQQRM